MAHRDRQAVITAVDHADALKAAQSTAESIELNDRFQMIESSLTKADKFDCQFDLVLLAQRLTSLSDPAAADLLRRGVAACRSGGRVVVIDTFRGPTKPNLAEAIEALTLELQTSGGKLRSLEETQKMLAEAGLGGIQFTFLAASQLNLGMAVGVKPVS